MIIIPEPVVFPPPAWPPRVQYRDHILGFKPCDTLTLLDIAARKNWPAILPGLLDSGSLAYINGLFMDEESGFELHHLFGLAKKTIEAVSGTTWGATSYLSAALVGNWFLFLAWCAENNFRYRQAPLPDLLGAAYTILRAGCEDDNKLTQLNNRIWPLKDTHNKKVEQQMMADALSGMKFDADGVPIG